jgi:fumarate hydratase class II
MRAVDVPADKLWGAQTQRSLEHFSIGAADLIPPEMITAYATPKKAAANANYAGGRLDAREHCLIVQACDEILAGRHPSKPQSNARRCQRRPCREGFRGRPRGGG